MDDTQLVQRIKQCMRDLGVNARQLAIHSNTGKSYIYDVLSGKSKNPTCAKLTLIAKTLNTSVSYLIAESNLNIDTTEYMSGHFLPTHKNRKPDVLLSKLHFDTLTDNFQIHTIKDNSMYPAIQKEDVIIVNNYSNRNQFIPSGIFLLRYREKKIVRDIKYVPASNKVQIIAQNENYPLYHESINNLNIIGTVKYCLRKI